MQILLKITSGIEKISDGVARISILLLWILCLLIFGLAVALNFSYVNSQLEDFSLYCFALMILLTFPYTLKQDRHVRLDLFYIRYSKRAKSISWLLINLCFIFPFCLVIAKYGLDFMIHSYRIGESSPNGKIPYYFIFKSFVVVGFILLALQSVVESLKMFCSLLNKKQEI
ncbi:TRAP transporter small permease subunit [Helicobacter mesocricetorum]|uniref:TRAP transporter small permease subunit n=1 Tax=Helicobacter mesocricetorum TaxID=87012 RepID=UPI0013157EC7|nr:TRAP transporter small permease subunit [Helicobacter mesocricetorum]